MPHLNRLACILTVLVIAPTGCRRDDGKLPPVDNVRIDPSTKPKPKGTGGSPSTPAPVDTAPEPVAPADASADLIPPAADAAEVGAEVAASETGGDATVDGQPAAGQEARWSHTMCNKTTLPFPKIDKNNGVFPIGSCPPPEDLYRECGNGSKLKITGSMAQSWERALHHPPEYAYDQYMMTRWSSNAGLTSWIWFDFGSEQTFQRIYLAWEVAHATDYNLLTSNDGTTWTMLRQVRGGDGYQDIIDVEGKGRYLRVEGVRRGPTGMGNMLYGYSLFDFTVCGQRP